MHLPFVDRYGIDGGMSTWRSFLLPLLSEMYQSFLTDFFTIQSSHFHIVPNRSSTPSLQSMSPLSREDTMITAPTSNQESQGPQPTSESMNAASTTPTQDPTNDKPPRDSTLVVEPTASSGGATVDEPVQSTGHRLDPLAKIWEPPATTAAATAEEGPTTTRNGGLAAYTTTDHPRVVETTANDRVHIVADAEDHVQGRRNTRRLMAHLLPRFIRDSWSN